jgi:photosystem II stability/assembly factor-like uncharacterized protein
MKLALLVLLTTAMSVGQPRPVQWQPVPVPTTASFRGLSVVDENTVWASGTEGTVIRTTDGGKTWSALAVPQAEKLDFRGIHAFDAFTAVIMSSGPAEQGQAHVYRTTDAGKHWTLVLEEKTPGAFFDAIAFWDAQHGILVGDPVDGHFMLYTTKDGGLTWQRVPPGKLPPALEKEGAFAASNSCLAVQGDSNVWFATGGASVARVFRSTDRGQSWAAVETPQHPANASTGIFSLAFRDAQHGIAVGGDYAHPTASPAPNLLTTEDSGITWQPASPSDPPALYFSGVAFQSMTVWAVGSNGMNAMAEEGKWHNRGDDNLNAVAFSSPEVGWAVGPKGAVARWTSESSTGVSKH